MDDGYLVHPERLRALSATFDAKSDRPPELAGKLDGASTVQTGDPSVDGTVHEDVALFASEIREFGEALSVVGWNLTDNADAYEEGEQDVGDDLGAIAGDLGPDGATDQAPGLGIVGRLEPAS